MANTLATGLTRDAVAALSRHKEEPEWMLQKRLQAWDLYESAPAPLGRRGDLGTFRAVANFKYQDVSPYIPANDNDTLSTVIQQSLKEALTDARAGHIVQHNATIVHIELDEALQRQGVILTALDTAVLNYPQLVQQYFMTKCVPVGSNKYTALHAASRSPYSTRANAGARPCRGNVKALEIFAGAKPLASRGFGSLC